MPLSSLLGGGVALDPGSESVRAMSPGDAEALAVPSLLARPGRGRLFLRSEILGEAALALAESAGLRGPGSSASGASITRPIVRGAVADLAAAERLFAYVFQEAPGRTWPARPRVVCGFGPGTTNVAKQALLEALERAGARRVHLVPSLSACAAAIRGQSVHRPQGTGEPPSKTLRARSAEKGRPEGVSGRTAFVIELRPETTGFGVASRVGVLAGGAVPLGTRDLDRMLAGYLSSKMTQGPALGAREARELRVTLGMPSPDADLAASLPRGRDPQIDSLDDVLPRHLGAALGPVLSLMAGEMRAVLARVPEGALEEIAEDGAVLAGGGALTPGLGEWFSRELQMPVRTAPRPHELRVRGLARILEEPELLRELA